MSTLNNNRPWTKKKMDGENYRLILYLYILDHIGLRDLLSLLYIVKLFFFSLRPDFATKKLKETKIILMIFG